MNKLSRIPPVLLCVFVLLPLCLLSASADGFDSGSGTKDDPYVITTADQLTYLSSSVSAGDSFEGKYIKLGADIVLNDTSDLLWAQSAQKWVPIGNPNTAFDGYFDGNGHTVSGAYVSSSGDCVGFFGIVGEKGSVISLTLANGDIGGNNSCGGIAGVNKGSIIGCRNLSAVRGEINVGGIAGLNNGSISRCENLGWIGNKGNNGGIAGLNNGSIENCRNSAAVDGGYSTAGGIAAENKGSISKCCNDGIIISEFGLAGSISAVSDEGSIEDCYYLDGYTLDKYSSKLTEAQMRDKSSFVGFDFDNIWVMGEDEYLYPMLREYVATETASTPDEVSEEASSDTVSDCSDCVSVTEPEQKDSYSFWVLLSILVILVIAKAIVGYVNKKKQ